jgi:hypothetical protein
MPKTHSPPAKQLFRVHISYLDFTQAIIFIDAARKSDDSSAEWWGLMLAAIVSCGRPFSGNERRGRPAAADSNLTITARMLREIIPDKDDRKLHRRIVRLRNKTVAHSESRYHSLHIKRSVLAGDPNSASDVALFRTQWHPAEEMINLSAFFADCAESKDVLRV